MNYLRFILISIVGLILIACENVGDKTPPVISQVYSKVTQFHPDYWEKAGEPVNTRLAVSFEFRVDDPDGFTDINTIDVIDTTNDQTYNIVTRLSNQGWGSYYNTANDIFEVDYFVPFNADRVELTGWQLNAKDLQGDSKSRGFGFPLPDGEEVIDEVFVYSSEYSAIKTDGIEAMEVMTVADNQLSIDYNSATGLITLEFVATDPRAKSYSIWFYTDTPNVKPVAQANHDSLAIGSMPIVTDQLTTLVLSQSDIEMKAISSVTQIKGAHIILSDASVDSNLLADEQWVAYEGVSEYLTISTP